METTEYKPTYEQLEKALETAMMIIRERTPLGFIIARDIEALFDPPPPTYKEVTVERWECDRCGATYDYDNGDVCSTPKGGGVCLSTSFTKLTGTRRVPVKQPVRKRVSVESEVLHGGYNRPIGSNEPTWGKHPECHGKTGTLTFEWEE